MADERSSAPDPPSATVTGGRALRPMVDRLRARRFTIRRGAEVTAVAAAFGLFLVVAFADVAVGDRTFAPNGRLATQSGLPELDYPYETPERSVVNDGGAFSWFFEPMARVVHEAYADGALPLWNPYAGLGMPLAANFQSAPAGPLVLPAFVHPEQATWDLVMLMRLLVGGVGCFALLRALGAAGPVAFVAASGYLLSSNFVLWLSSAALSVEALVPWLLLAILGLARRPGAGRFTAVALLTAAIALGGQPESLVIVAYVGAGWGLYWWLREGRSVRVLAELAGAALVGGALAAPLLLLSAEYVPLAYDAHGGRLGATRMDPAALPETLLGDFAERKQGAVGIGLLALAAAGVAGRRRAGIAGTGVLLALTGIWAVRALGLPGERVVGLLPGIDAVNVRRYGHFLAVLTAAVLAAAGLQAIMERSRLALAAAAGVAVFAPLLAWAVGVPAADAKPALLIGLGLVATVVAVAGRPALAPLLAVVLVAQFFLLTPRDHAREYDPFEPRPFVSYLQANLAPGERALALEWILRPQYPSALELADPRALDALVPRRYLRYMRLVAEGSRLNTSAARDVSRSGARSPLVAPLGVRYVVKAGWRPVLGPAYELVYRDRSSGRSLTVWRSRLTPGRAWSPDAIVAVPHADAAEAALARSGGELARVSFVERPTPAMLSADGTATVTVVEVAWNELRLRVRADGPAVVVVSDQFYPGWEAAVDGRRTEIRPANLAMRAVAVPDGEHELVFRYRPRIFRVGILLAALGAASLVARWFVPPVVRRLGRV